MKFNKPYVSNETIPNEPGSAIYEWQYINDNGDVVTEKKDMYAYIQSFERITNYKEFIDENGNLDPVFHGANSGLYCDVSAIPDDYCGLNSYIAGLVANLRAAIAEEQAKKAASVVEEGAQAARQAAQAATQTTDAKEGGNK